MSLQSRLVLVVLGLLFAGVVPMAGAVYGALVDWRDDRDDDTLISTSDRLRAVLEARPASERTLKVPAEPSDVADIAAAAAQRGDVPSFFQIRGADNSVLQTVGFGRVPEFDQYTDDQLGLPLKREEHLVSVGDWLVRSVRLSDSSAILVVGMQTRVSAELLARVGRVVLVVSVVSLTAVVLLALRLVRREMRPLDRITGTAGRIAMGDLSLRVHQAAPGTEIGRLGMALNGMLGQIEQAFAERRAAEHKLRQFIADASHELRTPIASVRGYAELFRRGADDRPEDLAKVMSRIESEAERMGVLVDELLLLARLDQGRPLEAEPVDLVPLAENAVADARATAPDRDFALFAADVACVRGDLVRLHQVLGNLLSNAVHHTPAGTPVHVRVLRRDGHAVIEVADHGPGVPEADRARIFERFFRSDQSRSRSPDEGGTGLGLAIVAAVAQAHGGTASVTGEPGGGACFRVTLPLSP